MDDIQYGRALYSTIGQICYNAGLIDDWRKNQNIERQIKEKLRTVTREQFNDVLQYVAWKEHKDPLEARDNILLLLEKNYHT